MVDRPGRREPVELEVDLDSLSVTHQGSEQRVVLGEANPVGIDQDPDDRSGNQLIEESQEVGVQRGLATGEHDDVQAPSLLGEAIIDGGEHLREGRRRCPCRRRLGETRGAAQVARVGDVREQDAGVLGLHVRHTVEVCRGDRREVAHDVGDVFLGRRGPLLEVGEDLGRLVIERPDESVLGATAFEPDLAVARGQPPRQATHVGQGLVGSLGVAVGAERVDVTVSSEVSQRHTGVCRGART